MVETEIDTDGGIAVHRCVGELVIEDVLIAAQRLFSNPDFKPEFSVVWDLRSCSVEITLEEIISLDPALVTVANKARPAGKTAWVASTAFGESIIRLLYDQHDWAADWQTFSTLDAAMGWCKRI